MCYSEVLAMLFQSELEICWKILSLPGTGFGMYGRACANSRFSDWLLRDYMAGRCDRRASWARTIQQESIPVDSPDLILPLCFLYPEDFITRNRI